MWRGSSIYFSKYIPSFPKAAADSCRAECQASSKSSSFQTCLIPRPPPPAVAFKITGYPISLAILMPCLTSVNKPTEPGMVGTPAAFMVSLADALSPMLLI